MSNTPARSQLGAFFRSPLGVRDMGRDLVYAFGRFDNSFLYYDCNVITLANSSGKIIDYFTFPTEWGADLTQIAIDPSGNIVMGGKEYYQNKHVLKYTPKGQLLWDFVETIGVVSGVYRLVVDKGGFVYALLDYLSHPPAVEDNFVVFSPDGEMSLVGLEIPGYKVNWSVVDFDVDSNGCVGVCGWFYNEEHTAEYTIAKFTNERSLIWKAGYYDDETGYESTFNLCRFDPGGCLFAARPTGEETSYHSLFKFGVDGSVEWSVKSLNDIYSMCVDRDGSVYVVGQREDGTTIQKYSSAGSLLWSADLGGSGYLVDVDEKGSVYTVVWGLSSYDSIVKHSSEGIQLWRKDIDGYVFAFLFGRNLWRK